MCSLRGMSTQNKFPTPKTLSIFADIFYVPGPNGGGDDDDDGDSGSKKTKSAAVSLKRRG